MSDISQQLGAMRVQAGDRILDISRENARVEVLADIHAHLERIEATLGEHRRNDALEMMNRSYCASIAEAP